MTNKELTAQLAKQMSVTGKEAADFLQAFVEEIDSRIMDNHQVAFLNAGSFELAQKDQRISVNPSTKKRMLVPPRLTLQFKIASGLKSKLKSLNYDGNNQD